MLSIQSAKSQKCTPNLLPARIKHNGPINDTERYWKPETDDQGKQHVHLRGRHLHGTSLPLPSNYTGAVLRITDKKLPQSRLQKQDAMNGDAVDDEDAVREQNEEIKIAEQVGEFDEIVVWGHGGEVDGGQDIFVRGMQEWLGFAESVHVDNGEAEGRKNSKNAS